MPSRYVIRNFSEGTYYHIFNRGVERRLIFLDQQDYQVFMYYLNIYLLPLEKLLITYPEVPVNLQNKNLAKEVEMISFCLMPNHFHFLVHQKSINGISKFLQRITNAYTYYFNERYKRVGSLFQGRFKAVLVESEDQLIQLSRYIHLNPVVASLIQDPKEYRFSSYANYVSENKSPLITDDVIKSFFKNSDSYSNFVTSYIDYATDLAKIKHLTLEEG